MKNKEKLTKVVRFIAIIALCYAISWIVTCGIIKLITICFGMKFKWSIATGIWLILCLLKSKVNMKIDND